MAKNKNKKVCAKDKGLIIITGIILILLSCGSMIADFCLRWRDGDIQKMVEILFPTFASLAGIWISCFLLFLQLYKDRYPLEKIKEQYLPQIKMSFLLVTYTVIYGCIVLFFNIGIISDIWFCCITIITIVNMLIRIYKSNRSLMINSYIDDFCSKVKQELVNADNSISDNMIDDLKGILEECVVKEEYYIVQKIVEQTGSIFKKFLECSISIREKDSIESIKDGFDKIVNLNIYLLKLCDNIKTKSLISKIVNQQRENLIFCMENCQLDWFKRYLERYNSFFYNAQKESKDLIVTNIYRMYNQIILHSLEEKKEYVIYMLDEIEKRAVGLFYHDSKISKKGYIDFLTGGIVVSIEEKKDFIYELLIKKVNDFSMSLCYRTNGFKEIKVYYDILFFSLKEKDVNKAYNFFKNIFEIEYYTGENIELIEFKFHCLSELIKVENIDNKQDEIYKMHIQLMEEVIELKEQYLDFVFFPSFEKKIFENEYKLEKITSIIEDIAKLMNRSLGQDNISMFYSLQKRINLIIRKTESRQKDLQIKLLDISFGLLVKTRHFTNHQFFEIACNSVEENIRELDKNRQISNSLMEYVIDRLVHCAQANIRGNVKNLIAIIEMLFEFLDKKKELNCIISNTKMKKQLYRSLFNIGTDCIENNCEEGLRVVSNSLGWFIIYSIQQATTELTMYLIARAEELYKISKNMEVSSQTQMFMLTLFTTVGTYCCGDNRLNRYKDAIVRSILDEDLQKVEVAVSLRTSENDTWNDLYNNHTVEWTRNFVKTFKEMKKNQK